MTWGATETTDFTASRSSGYFVDTTAGAITVTMPQVLVMVMRLQLLTTSKKIPYKPLYN